MKPKTNRAQSGFSHYPLSGEFNCATTKASPHRTVRFQCTLYWNKTPHSRRSCKSTANFHIDCNAYLLHFVFESAFRRVQ